MLANTPPMLEAHYGVPMTGAVLHTINTRLDAPIVAFQLDHANSKLLITDREFAPLSKAALVIAQAKPAIIDYDDPEFPQSGERLSADDYEAVVASGDPDFAWRMPDGRVGRHRAELHVRHHGQPEGRRLSPPRRSADVLRQQPRSRHGSALGLPVDAAHVPLQRLVLPLVAVGHRRHARVPAVGARQGDVRRHRRPRRDASFRRADRHVDAAQCDARGEAADQPSRLGQSRCRAAASVGARRDDGGGLPPHAPLRADRNVWPGDGQRVEPGVERPRRRGAAPSSARARACAMWRSRISPSWTRKR